LFQHQRKVLPGLPSLNSFLFPYDSGNNLDT
jgi:hypothetical protein